MKDHLLTVAIPTYNNFDQIAMCLATLRLYNDFPMRIIVVNNGDGSDADGRGFKDQLEKVTSMPVDVLQAEHNLGWAGGINRAFEEFCETELFCMLNDDTVFVPQFGFFNTLVKSFFEYADVGAVGPSSNFVMGSQSIFDQRSMYVHETTLLIGFCMIVRSRLFAEIGGLDEGLPGGDDFDLSILIRKAGYRLLVNRTCFLYHHGAQTGPRTVRPGYWNSREQVDITNNAIIRKHGVKAWYETITSAVIPFAPITSQDDSEGDWIRQQVDGARNVIDVGCGHNKTWPEAIGIDLRPRGHHGSAGGARWGEAATDMIADVRRIPLADNSQDIVIARHILEHMIDPFEALEEWRRVLRPGGNLLVAVPNEENCRSMLLDSSHVHAYTADTLRKIAMLSGFTVKEVTTTNQQGLSLCMNARKPGMPQTLSRVVI